MNKIVLLKHKKLNISPISSSVAILHDGELLYNILELIKSSLAGNKYNYFNPVVFLQGNIDRQSDCIIVDLQSDWIKKEIGSDTIYIKNG